MKNLVRKKRPARDRKWFCKIYIYIFRNVKRINLLYDLNYIIYFKSRETIDLFRNNISRTFTLCWTFVENFLFRIPWRLLFCRVGCRWWARSVARQRPFRKRYRQLRRQVLNFRRMRWNGHQNSFSGRKQQCDPLHHRQSIENLD